eukprot:g12826.t1
MHVHLLSRSEARPRPSMKLSKGAAAGRARRPKQESLRLRGSGSSRVGSQPTPSDSAPRARRTDGGPPGSTSADFSPAPSVDAERENIRRGGSATATNVSLLNWRSDCATRWVHYLPLLIFVSLIALFLLLLLLARLHLAPELSFYYPSMVFVLEDEEMLSETIDAAARSRGFAKSHIVLVLAMEARAGAEDFEKAQRLAQKHEGQFLDVLVNFHEAGEIPHEISGKSSNEQSAYLAILRMLEAQSMSEVQSKTARSRTKKTSSATVLYYEMDPTKRSEKGVQFVKIDAEQLQEQQLQSKASTSSRTNQANMVHEYEYDPFRTFITILDADSILHSAYFPLVTATALSRPIAERTWAFYQSAVFPFRNTKKLPGFVRASSYSHYIFEVGHWAAPANNSCHMAHSSYTIPFKLAEYVRGWDADVIPEDHHMFLKCFCESMWRDLRYNEALARLQQKEKNVEQGEEGSDPVGRDPIVLPADGSITSVHQLPPRRITGSRLALVRIPLPTLGYTVEAAQDRCCAHIQARYHQCVRHYYFVAELCYVVLHHVKLCRRRREKMNATGATSRSRITCAAHWQLFRLEWSIAQLMLFTPLYAIVMLLLLVNVVWVFSELWITLDAAMNRQHGEEQVEDVGQESGSWPRLKFFGQVLLRTLSPVSLAMDASKADAVRNANWLAAKAGDAIKAPDWLIVDAWRLWLTGFVFVVQFGVPLLASLLPSISGFRALKATVEGRFVPAYYVTTPQWVIEGKGFAGRILCCCCPMRYVRREYVKLHRDKKGNLIGDSPAYVEFSSRTQLRSLSDARAEIGIAAAAGEDVGDESGDGETSAREDGEEAAALIPKEDLPRAASARTASPSDHDTTDGGGEEEDTAQQKLTRHSDVCVKTQTMETCCTAFCLYHAVSGAFGNAGLIMVGPGAGPAILISAMYYSVPPCFYICFKLAVCGHTGEYKTAEKPGTRGPVALVRGSSIQENV